MENQEAMGGIILLGIQFLVFLISVAVMWKLFTKAGKPGWAAIIPIYNVVVMNQIIYGDANWWKFLFSFVPILNVAYSIMFIIRTAQAYGKDLTYGILSIFFGFITIPILAFSDSEYCGPVDSFI